MRNPSYSEPQQPPKPNHEAPSRPQSGAYQYYRGSLDSSSQQYKQYQDPKPCNLSYHDEPYSRNSPVYNTIPSDTDPMPPLSSAFKGSPSRSFAPSYHQYQSRSSAGQRPPMADRMFTCFNTFFMFKNRVFSNLIVNFVYRSSF